MDNNLMNTGIKQKLMVVLGWFFVALGVIGAFLPVMPTTVFLIVALWIFSKSSPRFHQMLLNNKYFGKDLQRWEKHKTMSQQSKKKATWLIFITFALSITVLHGRILLQVMLFCIGLILLLIIWRIKTS